MSGRTGADSHARASADAHPLSDLGDLLAADVVDDRSCLPTRATWRGVRFRFGGGVCLEQLGARAAQGEAPLTIEQLRGDFAWPFRDPASNGALRFSWPAADDVGVAVLYATPVGCARGIEVAHATARRPQASDTLIKESACWASTLKVLNCSRSTTGNPGPGATPPPPSPSPPSCRPRPPSPPCSSTRTLPRTTAAAAAARVKTKS